MTSDFTPVEAPLSEVRQWLHKLGMKQVILFCKQDNLELVSEDTAAAAVKINDKCPQQGSSASFNGKLDRYGFISTVVPLG